MSYEVVYANQYDLSDLVEEISMEDSLNEIAYCLNVKIVEGPKLPVLVPGQSIQVKGIPYGKSRKETLVDSGVVWDCRSTNTGRKHFEVTAYDKTIYLAKSEDERLMPGNQTASERLKIYAKPWGIPVGNLVDTKKKLSRNIKRSQTIMSMIMGDLKETVDKGGAMYRARMTTRGLELFEIGGNPTVWELDALYEVTQSRTLEGTVTQAKVLGQQDSDSAVSKTLAIMSKDTDKYGTLQKIIVDSNIETLEQAKEVASKALMGVQETISVTAKDINSIRAGDKVLLNKQELIVTRVRHQLGDPGRMELELATKSKVRRDYLG